MGELKWYKRDPDAALSGMMGLNLELRGAYNTVLDLIYTRDGNLPDDDRFIAGWLGVDIRVWRRLKQQLIDFGKLYLSEGLIRNKRADVEVLRGLSRVTSARDAGLASARSKQHKSYSGSPKNNHLASTAVETAAATPVPTTHTHNLEREEEAKASPSPARAKRGVRKAGEDKPLPEDWKPNLGPKVSELVAKWPERALEREEDAFRYHAATHGRLAKNWDAAFAMWLTRADERRGSGNGNLQFGRSYNGNRSGSDDGFAGAIDDRLEQLRSSSSSGSA